MTYDGGDDQTEETNNAVIVAIPDVACDTSSARAWLFTTDDWAVVVHHENRPDGLRPIVIVSSAHELLDLSEAGAGDRGARVNRDGCRGNLSGRSLRRGRSGSCRLRGSRSGRSGGHGKSFVINGLKTEGVRMRDG